MAYSLNGVYKQFETEVSQLINIIITLEATEPSLNRDTHIEGCFIRLVVCWEQFVEEYFLRCMCKAQTRSKIQIKPNGTAPANINEAFKKINKNRRDRAKDYIDWLDAKLVQRRINDCFRKNSRVQKICESPDKMFELLTIRNAIAHRSTSAISKFENYVKDQLGYLAGLNPTMADLLVQKRRNTQELIFVLISSYFLNLANRLTK